MGRQCGFITVLTELAFEITPTAHSAKTKIPFVSEHWTVTGWKVEEQSMMEDMDNAQIPRKSGRENTVSSNDTETALLQS